MKDSLIMKKTIAIPGLILSTMFGSAVALAAEVSESPATYVKDSAITMAVKSKLAADHINSFVNIHVDTDKDGVVWLTGSAHTQQAADQAMTIARETDGVKDVHSKVTVKKDD
jgi:hyperosmotically inducible periplasmic protein